MILVCSLMIFSIKLGQGTSLKAGRMEFLQHDYNFEKMFAEKKGPMVDPPAGHGLPNFEKPPYELTPDEIMTQYWDWQMLEYSAEQEFYQQTKNAIADIDQEKEDCSTLYTTEEEVLACQEKAELDKEDIIQGIEELQSAHAAEEEVVEAAIDFIVGEYYSEHPGYISSIGNENPNLP